MLRRDAYTCTYCGDTSDDMQVDHVIPKVSGGEDVLENLVSACRRCNLAKGRKPFFLARESTDRKSTRLNSSHVSESRMPSSA